MVPESNHNVDEVDFETLPALSESVETILARKLARKLVIEHIRNALSDKVELCVFHSFNSPEFQIYISKTLVGFPTL